MTERTERGVTLVDMALSLTVFSMILFGVMDFGRMAFAFGEVSHAAHAGTRWAIARGAGRGNAFNCTSGSQYNLLNFVKSQMVALDSTKVLVKACAGSTDCTLSTSCSASNPGNVVKVSVQYCFQPAVPFVPKCSSSCPSGLSGTGCTLTSISEMYIDGYTNSGGGGGESD